jgi:hypothetical protein
MENECSLLYRQTKNVMWFSSLLNEERFVCGFQLLVTNDDILDFLPGDQFCARRRDLVQSFFHIVPTEVHDRKKQIERLETLVRLLVRW